MKTNLAQFEKKVSKGQLFAVTTVVDEGQLQRLKDAPELVRETMEKAAFHWHGQILPDHFTRAAHGRYGYAERSEFYLKRKGSNPDLMRSGAMKSELLAKAAAKKKGASGVELRMTARALNFVPNSSNPFDVKILRSDNKHYPNMKRELREVTDEEQKQIANIVSTNLAAALSGEN